MQRPGLRDEVTSQLACCVSLAFSGFREEGGHVSDQGVSGFSTTILMTEVAKGQLTWETGW